MHKHMLVLPWFFSVSLHAMLLTFCVLTFKKIDPEMSIIMVNLDATPRASVSAHANTPVKAVQVMMPKRRTSRTQQPDQTPVEEEHKLLAPGVEVASHPDAAPTKDLVVNAPQQDGPGADIGSPAGDTNGQSEKTTDFQFGVASGPKFDYRVLPVFPLIARRLGKEGRVVLRLTIDAQGHLIDVEIVEKAGYGFTEAAIDSVRHSTFLPAQVGGQPVSSQALLPIKFALQKDA